MSKPKGPLILSQKADQAQQKILKMLQALRLPALGGSNDDAVKALKEIINTAKNISDLRAITLTLGEEDVDLDLLTQVDAFLKERTKALELGKYSRVVKQEPPSESLRDKSVIYLTPADDDKATAHYYDGSRWCSSTKSKYLFAELGFEQHNEWTKPKAINKIAGFCGCSRLISLKQNIKEAKENLSKETDKKQSL